ncbi:MAG: nucleotidyl transferase AbiEii/AbiGii toxin family protein [Paludibacter sp.]|nr:nucleotidyl transferase AbiEii/AbiGii toxin family protein [Paludibacter sp.]
MINQKGITVEWLSEVSKKHRNVDKILTEKTIRALLLLEGLTKQNIDFVFKGGTALMLHFNSTKRLSLDIDIILSQEIENFETILDNVAESQGFLRKELQQRTTQSKIRKEHYKFFFTPLHKTNKEEEYVLLDVLYEKVNYKQLIFIPIQSAFIPMIDNPLSVNVPSLNDILGDKLTAFAPNTTGIPYYKHGDSMSMEIIKQLYDIGNLADVVTDIETIKTTFHKFAETEITYRNESQTPEDVLNDIYQTALSIVTRGTDGNGNFDDLQKGIQRIKNLIFSENYQIEKAIIHASKAAYMATLIKHNASSFDKFEHLQQLKDWTISPPFNTKLNKLKKSNLEAFFYWHKIYEFEKK